MITTINEWRKHKLNENTDFIINYATELKEAVKELKAIQTVINGVEDIVRDEMIAVIDKVLEPYDTNLGELINCNKPSVDYIVQFATRNCDKWGTEKQMCIFAIGDVYNVFKK